MDKKAVLMVEEGQPEFIEQALNTILRRRDIQTKIVGKDVLPMAGEYTAAGDGRGRQGVSRAARAERCSATRRRRRTLSAVLADPKIKELAKTVPPRPPGFCIGCPERPIFAAMKLVEQELGAAPRSPPISAAICSRSCRRSISARTTMGYGLGPASASAFNVKADKRPISVMGDGGFWHNGLTSSIGNAVFNKHDGVIMVVDNFYSAATGGQDILSSRALNPARSTNNTDRRGGEGHRRQMGAPHRPHLRRGQDARHAERGADHQGRRPEGHRRVLRMHAQQAAPGEAAVPEGGRARASAWCSERFGVDEDVCTGDHACIRLSGCPSLSVKHTDDPLQATIRSRRSTTTASAAAIAARWRKPPCSARPSIAPTSSTIRPGSIASSPELRRAVIGFLQRRREATPHRFRRLMRIARHERRSRHP